MKLKFQKSVFWEIDPKTIDWQKNSSYIIKKVLEYGNEKDFINLKKLYSNQLIKQTLIDSRGLSPKTVNFWTIIFNLKGHNINVRTSHFPKNTQAAGNFR